MSQEEINPTYIMIKTHSITGMKYFCKTTKVPGTSAFTSYHGSGTRWKRHIKKHSKEFVVNELVLGPYSNKSELEALALWMSEELDIVNSNDWANLLPENGLDGGVSGILATGNKARGIPATGGSAKGVPKTGLFARGVKRRPATGKKTKGTKVGPATGNKAKGIPATGGSAKGVPKTGGSAKGVPKTGMKAKGVPNTGKAAKGVKRGPATGGAARGVPKIRKTPYEIVTCEHCGKLGAIGNMKRYHGDNCKNKCTTTIT